MCPAPVCPGPAPVLLGPRGEPETPTLSVPLRTTQTRRPRGVYPTATSPQASPSVWSPRLVPQQPGGHLPPWSPKVGIAGARPLPHPRVAPLQPCDTPLAPHTPQPSPPRPPGPRPGPRSPPVTGARVRSPARPAQPRPLRDGGRGSLSPTSARRRPPGSGSASRARSAYIPRSGGRAAEPGAGPGAGPRSAARQPAPQPPRLPAAPRRKRPPTRQRRERGRPGLKGGVLASLLLRPMAAVLGGRPRRPRPRAPTPTLLRGARDGGLRTGSHSRRK